MDDGQSPDRVPEEPDGEVDEQLLIPDDLFGAPPADLIAGTPPAASSSSAAFVLPEEIWDETTAVEGAAELVPAAGMQLDEDWWLPRDDVDDPGTLLLGPTVPAEPRTAVDAQFDENLVPAGARPTLAPPPVSEGRWSSMRRAVRGPRVKQRMAALALVGVAAVGAVLAMAARGPDAGPDNAAQQIDAGGFRPSSTLPTSTVPRPTSTSITTATAIAQPAPPIGGAPAASAPPPASPASPTSTSTPTPVTTAPARSTPPVTSPEPPPPTVTVAPPPTGSTLPPETTPPETTPPETTPTTRRPRPTIPDTTVAPTTTVASSTNLGRTEG